MKILASEKLSAHRFKTNEGYLICTNAIIARTGEQEYLESELNPSSMSQEVVKCYRPEEEVFAPETIASFENKPLTFHHPQEDVDTENYERLAIGFVRDVHREGNNLVANIIVNKQDAIDAIENGELEELSCGYDCEIIKEGDHYVQKDIRGNHVALVEAGRAGNARIIDSAINDAVDKNDVEAAWKKAGLKFDKTSYGYEFINRQHFDEAREIASKIAPGKYTTNSYINIIKFHDSVKDSFYSEAEKQDKEFVKNALEEMRRYERNWNFMSPERRKEIGCSLSELRQRIKELESVHDCIDDANKKLEHIIEYFDTWGYPSRSELQEAVNFYELSKSDVEKVFGKKYDKSELMKLHTHDAAIQDSKYVIFEGQTCKLLNPQAKPYGKVRPKIELPDGRKVETYWDLIKIKDSHEYYILVEPSTGRYMMTSGALVPDIERVYKFINKDDAEAQAKMMKDTFGKTLVVKTIHDSNVQDAIDIDEAIEYYQENAFGYNGLRDYVNTDFGHLPKEEREHIYKEMKRRLGDSSLLDTLVKAWRRQNE